MNRTQRLVGALAMVASLLAVPAVVGWLESLYPLRSGITGWMVYLLAALVVTALAALVFGTWVTPSWALARWLHPGDAVPVRALRTTVIVLILQPLVNAAVVLAAGPDTLTDHRWLLITVQGALLVAAALMPRVPGEQSGPWAPQRTMIFAGFAVAVALVLVPHVVWADYNPDGIEMLVLGRSLGARVIPRVWDGLPPTDLVMFTAAFPVAWTTALGGMTETAARLPVLAYAAGIGFGVLALVERDDARRLPPRFVAALLAGTGAAVLTLALNTAYHPYSTDVASPASIDLLCLVLLLACVYFVFEESLPWVVTSALLLALTRPTALILLGLLAISLFAVERNIRGRRLHLALIAAMTALAVAFLHGLARGDGGTLARIQYLRFDDWRRLAYLLIPSGIIPVIAWYGWQRFESASRALILLTLMYFAFFYAMAFYALHHFAPVMVLPLVVFWREQLRSDVVRRPSWMAATWIGIAVAIVAAMPREFTVYRAARPVGSSVSYEIGDYLGDFDGITSAFTGHELLDSVYTSPWIPDPQTERISESYTFLHYASVAGTSPESAQYVVLGSAAALPAGMTRIVESPAGSLWVRDTLRRRQERSAPPLPAPRSRLYDVPRTSLFRHLGLAEGVVQVDLRALAQRVRSAIR